MKRFLALVLLSLSTLSMYASYPDEVAKWRADRKTRLTSEDGWLTLSGLQWLKAGENKLILPESPAGPVHLTLVGGAVTMQPAKGLFIDGHPVIAAVDLRNDTDEKGPTIVKDGRMSFQVIRREDRFGIRIKDPKNPARVHFRGLKYFPTSSRFRVQAHFEPFNPPKKIPITNVLGMTSQETVPGVLVIKLAGRTYRLEPILEQGEKDLFIIFKDKTSGKETYGAARYLYAEPPDANGNTIVDFNRSYNPPCAFTKFATCPLPPPANRLPLRITAGELNYAH